MEIALSTTGEYIALSQALCEVIPMQAPLLKELDKNLHIRQQRNDHMLNNCLGQQGMCQTSQDAEYAPLYPTHCY